MWQPATFDPITIERELGWASQLGFNSIRVFLHNLLWQVEGDVFLERIDSFLSIATEKKLGTIFVIFDGVWDPQPHAGPQHAPIPVVHNSVWVQSPGAAMISDRSRWSSLKDYLQAVIGRFAHDRRVDAWDLFNEPDNPNHARERIKSALPYVVGKKARSPEGSLVTFHITGSDEATFAIAVFEGRAAFTEHIPHAPASTSKIDTDQAYLEMNFETLACLGCGRWNPVVSLQEGKVSIAGNVELGTSVLENLNFMI